MADVELATESYVNKAYEEISEDLVSVVVDDAKSAATLNGATTNGDVAKEAKIDINSNGEEAEKVENRDNEDKVDGNKSNKEKDDLKISNNNNEVQKAPDKKVKHARFEKVEWFLCLFFAYCPFIYRIVFNTFYIMGFLHTMFFFVGVEVQEAKLQAK